MCRIAALQLQVEVAAHGSTGVSSRPALPPLRFQLAIHEAAAGTLAKRGGLLLPLRPDDDPDRYCWMRCQSGRRVRLVALSRRAAGAAAAAWKEDETMRLILVGCEYAGKTTLADALHAWGQERGRRFHMDDHFTIPDELHGTEEQEAMLALPAAIKERFQRFQVQYHVHVLDINDDIILVGFHIEEVIYGPRYYYPGLKVTYPRLIERQLPTDAILVLLTARPDVIRERMAAAPHRHPVVQPADVEEVQQQFEAEFAASWIRRKVRLDTSELAPDQILDRFLAVVRPQLDVRDLLLLS